MAPKKVMGWKEWTITAAAVAICTIVAAIVSESVRTFFCSDIPAAWVQAVGSIAAILVAVRVATQQLKAAREQALEAEQREIDNILQAIRDEIETLWSGFQETFGDLLAESEPGTLFDRWWPSPNDPFVVYRGSANKIGHVKNHELRRAIVKVYARAEGMLATVRAHNQMLEATRAANDIFEESRTILNEGRLRREVASTIRYADTMRELHGVLVLLVEDVLRLLPARAVDPSN